MCIYSFPFLVVLQMVLRQMFHAAIYCSCAGTVTNTAGPPTQQQETETLQYSKSSELRHSILNNGGASR